MTTSSKQPDRFEARPLHERAWWAVLALYLATAAVITGHQLLGRPSNNFLIFRTATASLFARQDLYAPHPAQHYDLYKYSPTFALFFLPFAALPYGVALALWNLLNTVALCAAFRRLLPARDAAIVLALAAPAFAVATEGAQSNALVAAMIVAAFLAWERDRPLAATTAIVVGASIKLFPVSAFTFAIFRRRRWPAVALAVILGAAAVLLPLLVLSPYALRLEYASWHRVEQVDALDRGSSVMQLVHGILGVDIPNLPFQLAGTALVLLPLWVRRDRWEEPVFRLLLLASILVYAVIFNHQAERASFVIAAVGTGLWYVVSRRPHSRWRAFLAIAAAMGMHSALCFPAWVAIQWDLYSGPSSTAQAPRSSPD
ncbi:MAG: DUF2029 domain-containing protein [Gemmatimonadaceae bacterium]|nr:DUF2029 domain-containing protein [Gemmatimonadaceae bacterium]